MAAVVDFMESPLVTWVTTFCPGETIDYETLCEGIYLIDVLQQIDQRDWGEDINRNGNDSNAQMHNWNILLSHIRSYYKEVLQHIVVMKLPDVLSIIKEPYKESSLSSVSGVLLLLLGCAVLCEQRQDHIEKIKQLDVAVQTKIVQHIQEITDSNENVLGLDNPSEHDNQKTLHNILQTVTADRDHYSQLLFNVTQERDYYHAEVEGKKGPLSPPSGLEMYHLSKEIKQYKTNINNLTQENEEKSRQIQELREDNDRVKDRLLTLKTENFSLVKDAKAARYCRDELDAMKEKALKVDKYEKDILKYKERINELDYYKSQVDDLRGENVELTECRCTLQHEVTASSKRCDSLMEELLRYQIQLEEMTTEKDQLQQKYNSMSEEHALMEVERSNLSNGFTGINRMLSNASIDFIQPPDNPKSFSEEMNNSLSVHLARIENENQDLKHRLEKSEQELSETKNKRMHQLEAQETRHKQQVQELESHVRDMRQRMARELSQDFTKKIKEVEEQGKQLQSRLSQEFESRTEAMNAENQALQKKMKELQEEKMRQELHASDTRERLEQVVSELGKDKAHLQGIVASVQRQSTSRLHTLQRQVSELGSKAQHLQHSQERIGDMCDSDRTPRNSVDFTPASSSPPDPSEQQKRMTQSMNGGLLCHAPNNVSAAVNQRMSQSYSEEQRPRFTRISYVDNLDGGRGGGRSPIDGGGEGGRKMSSSSSLMSASLEDSVFEEDDRSGTLTRSQPQRPTRSQGTRTSPQPAHSSTHTTPSHSRSTSPSFSRHSKQMSWGASNTSLSHPSNHHSSTTPSPAPSPAPIDSSTPFSRSHSFRVPITPQRGSTTTSVNNPFSRTDITRQSMPEKRSLYVTPDQRKAAAHQQKSSRNPLIAKIKPSSAGSRKESCSGKTSPESLQYETVMEQILNTISISTTHTVKRHPFKMPKTGDKYKALVEKIMELQDRNQQLLLENSEIRRVVFDIKHCVERVDAIEKRNIELEVENRRLRRMVEALRGGGGSGQNNSCDSPYYYYSSV